MKKLGVTIKGEILELLGERAVFWPSRSILVVADLHLGKASHFRKSGVPLPIAEEDKDLSNLDSLITAYCPKEVIFLGDLFHSDYNREWEKLSSFVLQKPEVNFHLTVGNHDILDQSRYINSGIRPMVKITRGEVCFTHEPFQQKGLFNIYGHIHPGVRLSGKGRQTVKIPCFYYTQDYMIMPAFGRLTGTYSIRPVRNSVVVGIVDNRLLPVHGAKEFL